MKQEEEWMFLKQRKCKKNDNIESKMYNKIWSWNVSYLVLLAYLFPLAGQSCLLDQLCAPHLLQSSFLVFVFRSVFPLVYFIFRFSTCRISLLLFLVNCLTSHSCVYVCVFASVIASTDVSPLWICFFRSESPVSFPVSDRNFEARSSAAVMVSC